MTDTNPGSDGVDNSSITGTEANDCRTAEKEFVFKVVVVGDYSVGKTSLVQRLLTAPYPAMKTHTATPSDGNTPSSSSSYFPPSPHPSPSVADGDEDDVASKGNDNASILSVVPTVGTDFFSRVVHNVRAGQHVRLQFWDTAGLERYAAVHATTYRNASAVLAVFDLCDRRSLESLITTHLARAANYNANLELGNIIVVGNKMDLITAGRRGAGSTPTSGEAALTREDVQSILLNALPDVHYCEVSALTKAGVSALLQTLCRTLLYNYSGGATSPPQTYRNSNNEDGKRQPSLPRNKNTAIAQEETALVSETHREGNTSEVSTAYSPREGGGGGDEDDEDKTKNTNGSSNTNDNIPPQKVVSSKRTHETPKYVDPCTPSILVNSNKSKASSTSSTGDGAKVKQSSTAQDGHEGTTSDLVKDVDSTYQSSQIPNVTNTAVYNSLVDGPSPRSDWMVFSDSNVGSDGREGKRGDKGDRASLDSADFQRELERRCNDAEREARKNFVPPPGSAATGKKSKKVKLSGVTCDKTATERYCGCKC